MCLDFETALRRVAVVVLQVPAESFAALDRLIFDKWEDVSRLPARRSIPQILMRPFVVIVVGDEFRDQMPQVLLAADEEVIQKLLTQSLNEPLGVGIEVRGFWSDSHDLGLL